MNILITDVKSAVEYIHSLSRFGKKTGLSNTQTILERLGNPQNDMKFIHIAGTNGKGSVSNMIKNILVSHGYKVGYYTSPYIEFFSERICIGNTPISDEDLVYYTNKVKDVIGDITPIEFEFITAMAFLYFKDQKCDISVLEVGLGGRFDATNVIDTPLLNVITSIGFDHTAILGDTLEKISFEKSGTIKENSTVVISPSMATECTAVIRKKCEETNSFLKIPDSFAQNITYTKDGTFFEYKDIHIKLSLLGTYQVSNAVLAIEACLELGKKLPMEISKIQDGLSHCQWKCRFEIRGKNPCVVFDGAHNSHGIEALSESIKTYFPSEKKVFVFSMLTEKDWKESIDLMCTLGEKFIITTVPSVRQSSPDELVDHLLSKGVWAECIEDNKLALNRAIEIAGKDGVVFVTGSLYLCGALRSSVEN